MLKLKKPTRFGSFPIIFLAAVLIATTVQPAFAAESDGQKFNAKVREHITVSGAHDYDAYGEPEWQAQYDEFMRLWNGYFLDLLPDDTNPEALRQLTSLPEYENVYYTAEGEASAIEKIHTWEGYFSDGEPKYMRDESYTVYNSITGLADTNLSTDEKAKIVADYFDSDEFYSRGHNRGYGSFVRLNDGYDYDCTTAAEGRRTVYRLAGVPATTVQILTSGTGPHEETFFYADGEWRHSRDYTVTLLEYFRQPFSSFLTYITGSSSIASQYMVSPKNTILDVNESWIDQRAEVFMMNLLGKPYVNPDKTLTRGEVAKILCNYLGVAPMRNEQVFSDVPTTHKYAPYIWAVNKLGIMTGDGDGAFGADTTLSLQEFAVMAGRVSRYKGGQLIEEAKSVLQDIENNPTDWPPNSQSTQNVISRIRKEARSWDEQLADKVSGGYVPKVFADGDQIASWAKASIDEMCKLAILEGDGDGPDARLNPTEPMSKLRFLVFLYKLEDKLFGSVSAAGASALF